MDCLLVPVSSGRRTPAPVSRFPDSDRRFARYASIRTMMILRITYPFAGCGEGGNNSQLRRHQPRLQLYYKRPVVQAQRQRRRGGAITDRYPSWGLVKDRAPHFDKRTLRRWTCSPDGAGFVAGRHSFGQGSSVAGLGRCQVVVDGNNGEGRRSLPRRP